MTLPATSVTRNDSRAATRFSLRSRLRSRARDPQRDRAGLVGGDVRERRPRQPLQAAALAASCWSGGPGSVTCTRDASFSRRRTASVPPRSLRRLRFACRSDTICGLATSFAGVPPAPPAQPARLRRQDHGAGAGVLEDVQPEVAIRAAISRAALLAVVNCSTPQKLLPLVLDVAADLLDPVVAVAHDSQAAGVVRGVGEVRRSDRSPTRGSRGRRSRARSSRRASPGSRSRCRPRSACRSRCGTGACSPSRRRSRHGQVEAGPPAAPGAGERRRGPHRRARVRGRVVGVDQADADLRGTRTRTPRHRCSRRTTCRAAPRSRCSAELLVEHHEPGRSRGHPRCSS